MAARGGLAPAIQAGLVVEEARGAMGWSPARQAAAAGTGSDDAARAQAAILAA